ncbi:MAG TPA: hypothetical protein VFY10_00900 [Dehalococcoidia bacterium]|nr:hypothetical protein [Dehalococcoidia bacterium]
MARGGALFIVMLLAAAGVAACGGGASGPASLSLTWSADKASSGPIAPNAAVQTKLTIRNDGGETLDSVQLRFDQHDGVMPFGVSVGTATNLSSSFDGDTQVWSLGTLKPGDVVVFPIGLWFQGPDDSTDTLPVTLFMGAKSPGLKAVVLSNPFEVEVDGRLAVTGR